jgi:hypothetical protein
MRGILHEIAEDVFGPLGDIWTLADPVVVDDLAPKNCAGSIKYAFRSESPQQVFRVLRDGI